MRRLFALALCALSLFLSFGAYAQSYEYTDIYCDVPGKSLADWGQSKLDQITVGKPNNAGSYFKDPPSYVGTVTCQTNIQLVQYGNPTSVLPFSAQGVCLDNTWTMVASELKCRRPVTCTAGDTRSKTFADGWYETSTSTITMTDPVVPPPVYCDAGCEMASPVVTDAFSATEPSSNGFYEGSATFEYTLTGASCAGSTPDPGRSDPPATGGGDTGGGDPDSGDGSDPGTGDGGDPGTGDGSDPDGGDDGADDGTGSTDCTPEQEAAGTCTPGTGDGDPGAELTCTPERQQMGLCCLGNAADAETCPDVGAGGGGTDDGSDEWGQPANIGTIYEAKDKTIESVLEDASAGFKTSELGSAVSGFFTITGGGACPVYTASIPYVDAVVTIDAFCQSWVQSVAAYIKAALLLVAAFYAFRVAFL